MIDYGNKTIKQIIGAYRAIQAPMGLIVLGAVLILFSVLTNSTGAQDIPFILKYLWLVGIASIIGGILSIIRNFKKLKAYREAAKPVDENGGN